MIISVHVTVHKGYSHFAPSENSDIFTSCDLNSCTYLFPLPLSRNQIALLKIHHIISGLDLKKLYLKASTEKLEKIVNCFGMRQNGVCCAF